MLYIIIFLLIPQYITCKILIIGAGASGLAAATRLIEKNVTNFQIFEAENRLGGRIHSIYLLENDGKSGKFVDLGGEYVGGAEGNVVYQISKNNLEKRGEIKMEHFDNDGEIDLELSKDIEEFKVRLPQEFKNSAPISIKDAFLTRYNATILDKYKNYPTLLEIAKNYIESCENSYLYAHGAFDWSKILLISNHKLCKGGDFSWNGKGYKFFLDTLMRKFGDEHRLNLYPIFYQKKVVKIAWNGSENVEIYTENGEKHVVDHVIFTPSVGVLKEKHAELFVPKLGQNKVDAIKNIGFDGAIKIILQYEKKWWNSNFSGFSFVWKNDEDIKLWQRSFQQLLTIPGVENTLIAWFTGPQVPKIENFENHELKDGVNFVIKKFLGNKYNVTEPKIIIPSSWYSNPNFRGVYSYETLASGNRKKQLQEDLAEPLVNDFKKPVVFFAGEHTHKTHFSTVHGAVESGYRAAEEIVKYLNK